MFAFPTRYYLETEGALLGSVPGQTLRVQSMITFWMYSQCSRRCTFHPALWLWGRSRGAARFLLGICPQAASVREFYLWTREKWKQWFLHTECLKTSAPLLQVPALVICGLFTWVHWSLVSSCVFVPSFSSETDKSTSWCYPPLGRD